MIFDKRSVPNNLGGLIRVGVKRSTFNSSEHSHVAYQIKVNYECSNLIANILPVYPCPPQPLSWPWVGGHNVKIKLFQNTVVLHIKLKGITNAAREKKIVCPQTPQPYPPLSLGVESKGQNSPFSELLHIKLNILRTAPISSPIPLGSKCQIELFQNMVMFHIKLNGFMNAATW